MKPASSREDILCRPKSRATGTDEEGALFVIPITFSCPENQEGTAEDPWFPGGFTKPDL